MEAIADRDTRPWTVLELMGMHLPSLQRMVAAAAALPTVTLAESIEEITEQDLRLAVTGWTIKNRTRFLRALTEVIWHRCGKRVDWPTTFLLVEPNDVWAAYAYVVLNKFPEGD